MSEQVELSIETIDKMKVVALKAQLKSFGLSTTGLKAELVARLKMYVSDVTGKSVSDTEDLASEPNDPQATGDPVSEPNDPQANQVFDITIEVNEVLVEPIQIPETSNVKRLRTSKTFKFFDWH